MRHMPGTAGGSPLLAVAALLGPAGCAGPEGGTGVVEGGPVAYVSRSFDSGDGALLEGTVTVTENCLLIVDELDQTWLPVFQLPRTTWDGTALTYNGRGYTEGRSIRLEGGGSENTVGADYTPQGCEFDYAFYVGP